MEVCHSGVESLVPNLSRCHAGNLHDGCTPGWGHSRREGGLCLVVSYSVCINLLNSTQVVIAAEHPELLALCLVVSYLVCINLLTSTQVVIAADHPELLGNPFEPQQHAAQQRDCARQSTMRFGSTAKVLLKCRLKYYRISECKGLCPDLEPNVVCINLMLQRIHSLGDAACLLFW